MTLKEASRTVKFWSPSNFSFDEATNKVELKAPEEGNKSSLARNQLLVRTRAGTTIVYDKGNNFNTRMSLDFKNVTGDERSQFVAFMEAIQWASTKVAYQDMYGDLYYIRVLGSSDALVDYTDQGLNTKRGPSFTRWDFSLTCLNLTDSSDEVDTEDGPVTSPLTLHLMDYFEPHNPETTQVINIADSTVHLESYLTKDWKCIVYSVTCSQTAKKLCLLCSVSHDRNGITIATKADLQSQILNNIGDLLTHLTFGAGITGSSDGQSFFLTCATDSDGVKIQIRRLHLGAGQ